MANDIGKEDVPIFLPPGIYKEASEYAAKNRWIDGSNVRFWRGFPERLGGFDSVSEDTTETPARGIFPWRALDGTQFLGLGGASFLNLLQGGTIFDITPDDYISRVLTVSSVVGTFSVGETITGGTSSSTAVVLADGGTTLSVGNISGEFTATETITGGTSSATATVDSWDYGGSVDSQAEYGWGDGTWSISVYGGVQNLYSAVDHCTTWTMDNWGEDLVCNPRGGKVYVWEKTGTPYSPAVAIAEEQRLLVISGVTGTYQVGETITGGTSSSTATIKALDSALSMTVLLDDITSDFTVSETITGGTSGATATVDSTTYDGSPQTALGVFVADTVRILVAYGAHDGTSDDPLNIRWTDYEDYTDWRANAEDVAGSIRCETGNTIVGVVPTRGGYMFSTDTAIYRFSYSGPPAIFSLVKIADGPSMIGPHSGVDVNGVAYWMGPDQFYTYDGVVRELKCDLHSYVYDALNSVQAHKIVCGTNRKFSEVWWHIPTTTNEVDTVIIYNYAEPAWYIGSSVYARTSWTDTAVVFNFPIGTDASGYVYAMERGTLGEGLDISYSLESGDIEAMNGNYHIHARAVIPDWERITGTHTLEVDVRGHPQRAARTKGPYSITSSTYYKAIRARGRQMRFKFSGSDDFRLGLFKVRPRYPVGRKL